MSVVCLTRAGCQVPTKALYHSPFSAGQGRENKMKISWLKVRTEIDHLAIAAVGKTDLMKLIYCQSNQSSVMRK